MQCLVACGSNCILLLHPAEPAAAPAHVGAAAHPLVGAAPLVVAA
jgi:hypothetical protein